MTTQPHTRRRHSSHRYRDTASYAVHQLTVRPAGTNSPTDPGDIRQGPVLRVFPTQTEAEQHADSLRAKGGWPDHVCFSITARYHDRTGKIVDQEQDVYVA